MEYLRFFEHIHKEDVNIAGGKGASLGEMSNAKFSVPAGFVILSSAFDRFLDETNLHPEIMARLKEVNFEDTNTIDRASNVIRDIIGDQNMPEDLASEIIKAYHELNAEFVAVRSSATAEDSSVASWAGELETYLNTIEENLLLRVKRCWSSLFTPRAIFYRFEKNLIDQYVSVAVVIQKMIQSEISGIAFTVHPVTQDYDQMIIEAGFGLGEAIVSGQVTPDSYVISKENMSILDINIGSQTRKFIKNIESHNEKHELPKKTEHDEEDISNEWVELSKEDAQKQKLSGKQIIELAEICKTVENHYGFPCDIEWAFAEGKFYITQSRPITTLTQK